MRRVWRNDGRNDAQMRNKVSGGTKGTTGLTLPPLRAIQTLYQCFLESSGVVGGRRLGVWDSETRSGKI